MRTRHPPDGTASTAVEVVHADRGQWGPARARRLAPHQHHARDVPYDPWSMGPLRTLQAWCRMEPSVGTGGPAHSSARCPSWSSRCCAACCSAFGCAATRIRVRGWFTRGAARLRERSSARTRRVRAEQRELWVVLDDAAGGTARRTTARAAENGGSGRPNAAASAAHQVAHSLRRALMCGAVPSVQPLCRHLRLLGAPRLRLVCITAEWARSSVRRGARR